MLVKNLRRHILKCYFQIFTRKLVLTFHAKTLLRRQFAWNVKACLLGKIRKISLICCLLNLLRVVQVKSTTTSDTVMSIDYSTMTLLKFSLRSGNSRYSLASIGTNVIYPLMKKKENRNKNKLYYFLMFIWITEVNADQILFIAYPLPVRFHSYIDN